MKALFGKLWSALGPWLRNVLSEAGGAPSSVRLVMFGWNLAVLVVWLTLCIYYHGMVKIDESVLGVLAIANGGKIVQRFGEPDGPPCDKPPGC